MAVLVLFRLSGHCLALPAGSVAEVVAEPRLIHPPGAPPAVDGVMNRRGRPVPVVRLWRLLDLPEPPGGLFRAVLVLSHPLVWAMMAERVDEVTDLPLAHGMIPDLTFNDCVAAVASVDERLVPVLDPERLFRRNEVNALEAFSRQAARRPEDFALGDG